MQPWGKGCFSWARAIKFLVARDLCWVYPKEGEARLGRPSQSGSLHEQPGVGRHRRLQATPISGMFQRGLQPNSMEGHISGLARSTPASAYHDQDRTQKTLQHRRQELLCLQSWSTMPRLCLRSEPRAADQRSRRISANDIHSKDSVSYSVKVITQ